MYRSCRSISPPGRKSVLRFRTPSSPTVQANFKPKTMHSVAESPIIHPINTDRTAFPLTFPHFLFLLPSFLQLEEIPKFHYSRWRLRSNVISEYLKILLIFVRVVLRLYYNYRDRGMFLSESAWVDTKRCIDIQTFPIF